jgi:hypothetical protein
VAERVDSSLRVRGEFLERGENDARATEDHRGRTGAVDAHAHRTRSLVAGPRRHRNVVGADPGERGALQRGREPVGIQLERGQNLLAPPSVTHVEQQRAGGVGDIGHMLSAQPQPYVVLG